jgi:hypothetical protein
MTNCVCATSGRCKMSVAIYDARYYLSEESNWDRIYTIPGWMRGCSPIDSLLLSTLQCLYTDSDCFPFLVSYLRWTYHDSLADRTSISIHPLVYYSTISRFPPNTSISTVVEQLMIEQWNPVYPYHRFYAACAPSYCTYSRIMQKKTIVGVILTLMSTIGGLTVSLRVFTPHLVTSVFSLLAFRNRRPQQQQQQRGNC